MCSRTIVLLMCMFFLVQAGRFKKTGVMKHLKNYNHIRRNTSSNSGLWPSSFNLATKALIYANATCGENGREEFCRMVEGGKGRCGICDNYGTDSNKKHPIIYAIDGTNKWWQSPALFYGTEYEYVTITIDLKQIYQITDVIIRAAISLRPGTWILERSLNGLDYEVWQYFARSDKECLERFGIPGTKGKPHYFTDSEVICTSFYSKLQPLENGEIHTSLINGRPGVGEVSPELLEFTKARFVQLRLIGLRGTIEPLPRWFLQDALRKKRLFYTIRDISIIGYCVCNGHAENCRHNVASGHPECECAHHTCGPNCDRCCPMYNQRAWGPGSSRDAHQCLPCNCHGHATSCHYDENVDKAGLSMDINGNYQGGGVCDNCTAHTTGINCERCETGYYRPHGTEIHEDNPCIKCDCDSPGSLGTCVQEGEFAGKCDCMPGYKGNKCEFCDKGFKGWPQCELCPCDSKGTLPMENCEDDCVCKENVEGKFCNSCKSGYFGLKGENPEGCTKCYCSGVTTLCESITAAPKKIQTLDQWLITDSKISVVAKPIWDNKGLFSIGSYELPNSEFLYWLAPEAYLGNKLEYYGSTLIFKVHWVIMRGDTSGKPTTGPNIILIGGNGIKIAHGYEFFTTSNETFEIQMTETGWYHLNSSSPTLSTISIGAPVNRNQFLGILSNISSVLLRATFHTDQIESLLEVATLDGETDDVEKCWCPSGYTGLSCESCAYGYVRIITNVTTMESFCGKCDCNGHSETCNPDTAECFCEHNTTGDNCERCKPGFYGNPLKGTKDDCKKCACPLENDENNFSPSCQLDYLSETSEEGGYVCTQCPKGYTGDHCEICDDGYFGNPLIVGDFCKVCNCNGGPCDKLTGQCLSCKGNTEGWRCEKCKMGYYGNALMSNCVSCQCDPIGAISQACDIETGQCECKERFTGRTCNKCEVGYGNVTALCVPCACNSTGSISSICDQHTGLCECKKGVDGFHCDACQNMHYGFSEIGCKECKCDKDGSRIQACDQNTGKCRCKPQYEGDKCDRCKAGYWKSQSQCKPCDCDKKGSISTICDPKTGLCKCNAGVKGQQCDSCQEKHYGNVTVGCKECDPCDKEGHICDPTNGKCVCPKLTEGEKCERCVPNAWGHEPGLGCKPCDCSLNGTSSLQCDSLTGRCTCRDGYEGEKCNKCSFGYYGHKNCKKCNCNIAGTRFEDCFNGICKCSAKGCRCKENVFGFHCDQCKKGTFGIDLNHPLGCIDCFCSNRSRNCSLSEVPFSKLITHKVMKIPSAECTSGRNCWNLPESFSGDLMHFYGGQLRIPPSDNVNINVTITGNDIMIEGLIDPRHYTLILTEFFWSFKLSSYKLPQECLQSLTRGCLMIILQNVTKIQIESNANLEEVVLDTSNTAEKCTCSREYTSASCQDPNLGYFRYRPKATEIQYNYIDRIIGVAKKCECNNRSKICDKETGHCLDCQGYTTGPHCEFCAKGYYKDADGKCAPCRCPTENQNFAENCTLLEKNRKQFVCFCKRGYLRPKCDKCEDGYWGNPLDLGGSCQPCDCNPYGSVNIRCDKSTGLCQCKPGFTGEKCSKCSSPRQVISEGVCIPCDECSQILFYTIDELTKGLDKAMTLFENGIGPPWSLLNSTINQYHLLNEQFENVENVKNISKTANFIGLEERIQKLKDHLGVQDQTLSTQIKMIDRMQSDSNNISTTIHDLETTINYLIKKINGFGKSQINVEEALREAKDLLRQIVTIYEQVPRKEYYQNISDTCDKHYEEVNNIYGEDINLNQTKEEIKKLKTKLNDLANELTETESNNELTNTLNSRNAARINSLKQKINQLDDDHTLTIKSISDVLKKINATNALLQEMERINENLLTIDLEDVIIVEDESEITELYKILDYVRIHVKSLQDKIKSYKNLFNFTPEEWTKIDASSAYENIIKGVESAWNVTQEAKRILSDTVKKLYPSDDDSMIDKTSLAKAFSDRIQKRAMNLDNLTKDFDDALNELDKLKHNFLINGKSNNELNSFLRNIMHNLSLQSETIEKLSKVKKEARNISATIESIDQRLRDTNISIQYELMKTYEKYLNLSYCEDIKSLNKTLNETNDRLNKLNTSFTEKSNISNEYFLNKINDLDRIKMQMVHLSNLIQDGSERVEAIDYGVNIRKCQRQYKVKSEIFNSLEIRFQCDYCLLFNLSNKIVISYNKPKVKVKWQNSEKEVTGNSSVSVRRLGSKIHIETDNSKTGIHEEKPFKIENNYVLSIGNLLNNNSNEACLQKIILNNRTIGLWKFEKSEGNCSVCSKYSTNEDNVLYDAFFNGNAYRKVIDATKFNPQKLNFIITFATFDENSLLMLAQDKENVCSYIAVNIKDGFVKLEVKHITGLTVGLISKEKYNNGKKTIVEISMEYDSGNEIYVLKVLNPAGKIPVNETKTLDRRGVFRIKRSQIFIGGISSLVNKSCLAVNITSFVGNLKIGGAIEIGNQNSLPSHIEPALKELQHDKVWFPGDGYLFLQTANNKEISNLSFSLKPMDIQNNFIMNINNILELYFKNSSLIFKQNDTEIAKFESICLNDYNFIKIEKDNILVKSNSKRVTDIKLFDTHVQKLHFRLGNYEDLTKPSYVGSINDIFLNDIPVLFNSKSVKKFSNVEIGRDRVLSKAECEPEMQNTERYSHLPEYKTEPQAFKFGDKANSFVLVKNIVPGKKIILEFQFRTFYPNGLLLFSSVANKNFYIALEVYEGDIRLQVQGRKTKTMKIDNRINNGVWHNVQVEQIVGKKKWRLVVKVDKKWKIKERMQQSAFNGDLYFGGIVHDLNVQRKKMDVLNPLRGCIGSLKINKNPIIVKNNINIVYNNIGQCFQNVEEGAYFGGDSYAIYKHFFKVNKFLELMFQFKTSEPNGILLSVSNYGNTPALSVELQNGAVVMTVDMGNGIISQVTNSLHSDSTLANNKWHNITALYSSSELTVNVDGIRKSWVQSDINSMMDEIEAPLYIGGLPSNAPSGTLKIKENFKGCIRKFKIEDNIMDWTDMKELNNVQLNSCLA